MNDQCGGEELDVVQLAQRWLSRQVATAVDDCLDEGDCRCCGHPTGEGHEPTDPCGIVAGLLSRVEQVDKRDAFLTTEVQKNGPLALDLMAARHRIEQLELREREVAAAVERYDENRATPQAVIIAARRLARMAMPVQELKAPDQSQSTQWCGCDPGAKWICLRHRQPEFAGGE